MKTKLAVAALICGATSAFGQNLLTNPGFEDGLNGWNVFGNAYPEAANPPEIVPFEGNGVAKMFGNFSGGFDVTGIFQEFVAAPEARQRYWARAFVGWSRMWVAEPNTTHHLVAELESSTAGLLSEEVGEEIVVVCGAEERTVLVNAPGTPIACGAANVADPSLVGHVRMPASTVTSSVRRLRLLTPMIVALAPTARSSSSRSCTSTNVANPILAAAPMRLSSVESSRAATMSSAASAPAARASSS